VVKDINTRLRPPVYVSERYLLPVEEKQAAPKQRCLCRSFLKIYLLNKLPNVLGHTMSVYLP
jgi:hypothetical protein